MQIIHNYIDNIIYINIQEVKHATSLELLHWKQNCMSLELRFSKNNDKKN